MSTIDNQNSEYQRNSDNNSNRTSSSVDNSQQISENYDSDEFESDIDENPSSTSTTSADLDDFLKFHKLQKSLQQNLTFKPAKLREIEMENSYLMTRILRNSTRKNQYPIADLKRFRRPSNFLRNQQRTQMKIDYENQILWRKIQKAKPSIRRD